MPPTTAAAAAGADPRFEEGPQLPPDQPDRALSSNEIAMANLEQEIMALDESVSSLNRRLKPVKDNTVEKSATNITGDPNPNPPALSPLAQSINEKTNRVRSIRNRVNSITSSIDL